MPKTSIATKLIALQMPSPVVLGMGCFVKKVLLVNIFIVFALMIVSNYNEDEGVKILHWIQMMTGCDEIPEEPEQISGSHDNFYELLQNGLLLSKLIDALYPGHINWNDRTFQTPKIEAMRMMREKERIASFNNLVQEFGVLDSFVFPTDSLHDRGVLNLAQVCSCIRALGIEAQTKPDYRGPENYWPKKSTRNVRNFTEEQLRAGENVIGLQAGSNKGASQAGLTMGKQRMILD